MITLIYQFLYLILFYFYVYIFGCFYLFFTVETRLDKITIDGGVLYEIIIN